MVKEGSWKGRNIRGVQTRGCPKIVYYLDCFMLRMDFEFVRAPVVMVVWVGSTWGKAAARLEIQAEHPYYLSRPSDHEVGRALA